MSLLTVPFARPWQIKLPVAIRYLEKQYVEDFFSSGWLMLSSFHKFRKHLSEELGDVNEGRVNLQIKSATSEHAVMLIDGSCAFVFSTSTIESKDLMKELSPKYEEGFRIHDTVAFSHAVAAKVPEFIGGFQGACVYRDDLVVRRNNAADFTFVPPNSEADAAQHMENYQRYVEQQNNLESFLLKSLRYSRQNEFRFVWRTSLEHRQEELLIKCPDALRFCERLRFDD